MIEETWAFLVGAAKSDFFAGGVALGTIGLLVTVLRSWWFVGMRMAGRRFCASVSIDNRSGSYRHLLLWLEHCGALKSVRQLSRIDPHHSGGTNGFTAAPGTYWFWHSGRLCSFSWDVDENRRITNGRDQSVMETLKVTMVLGRVDEILSWVIEGEKLARKRDKVGPGLHVLRGDYWDHVGDMRGRSVDSVVHDDDRIKHLLEDMRWFYGAQDWYTRRGVPWRRGYLLHGPPGTGKSSLVKALATDLQLDIATMDLGRVGMTDDDLREAMMDAPNRALLVIEDVDAIFIHRDGMRQSGISFSGLLNAIDGVGAQEGRALIMTTNHIDRLDPALIRPGRADVHIELGLIGGETAAKLFDRFFPGEEKLCIQFSRKIGNKKVAPSAIQGWLLQNANEPKIAAQAAFLKE